MSQLQAVWLRAAVVVVLAGTVSSALATVTWNTLYFQQPVDHFSFVPTSPSLFSQKYLVNDSWWRNDSSNPGPILFYTGNEAPIEAFAAYSGLVWTLAQQVEGVVVFAEHRYFGSSTPQATSSRSSTEQPFKYLSSEQALADYVALINFLREQYEAASQPPPSTCTRSDKCRQVRRVPCIAIGGSYGGALAAWMRVKYPFTVDGAIASSAPQALFGSSELSTAVAEGITHSFDVDGSGRCPPAIRSSFESIYQLFGNATGRALLTKLFRPCAPFESYSDFPLLYTWLYSGYLSLAQENWPYPVEFSAFSGRYIPAWTVNTSCTYFVNSTQSLNTHRQLLLAAKASMDLAYNASQASDGASCYNMSQPGYLNNAAFLALLCTEIVVPQGSSGVHDMFLPNPWNFTAWADTCASLLNLTTRPGWTTQHYGGADMSFVSNILFTNSLLDPWKLGVAALQTASSLPMLNYTGGAHTYDLAFPNELDHPSVKQVRNQELSFIQSLLKR